MAEEDTWHPLLVSTFTEVCTHLHTLIDTHIQKGVLTKMWRNWALWWCWWDCRLDEDTIENPQDITNRPTIWPINPSAEYLDQSIHIQISETHWYFCIHYTTTQSSQHKETEVSTHRWTEKENVAGACNGIVSKLTYDSNPEIFDKTDES